MKIKLFCAVGMSTSILVKKIKEAANAKKIDIEISAYSVSNFDEEIKNVDIVLIGPQIQYMFTELKEKLKEKNIPIGVVPMQHYGMMNGEKVLEFALELKK